MGTLNFFAWESKSCKFFDPDARPTTLNFPGLAATISKACRPIEPVEPKMTISRMGLSSQVERKTPHLSVMELVALGI